MKEELIIKPSEHYALQLHPCNNSVYDATLLNDKDIIKRCNCRLIPDKLYIYQRYALFFEFGV